MVFIHHGHAYANGQAVEQDLTWNWGALLVDEALGSGAGIGVGELGLDGVGLGLVFVIEGGGHGI